MLDLSNKFDVSVEIIGLQLHNNSSTLNVVGMYRHSNSSTSQASLDNFIALTTTQDLTLLIDDFNAHHPFWGVSRPNKAGRIISEAVDRHNCVILNPSLPTFYFHPTRNSSLIDLAIASSSLASLYECAVLEDTRGSNHYPIPVQIDCHVKCFFFL